MDNCKNYILRHRYFILSTSIIILTICHALFGKWVGDFWEHSAVIRELSTNPFSPNHPQLLIKAPHVFFSPYTVGIALIAKITHCRPVLILSIFGIINITIFLIFFYKFVSLLMKTDNSPFYALILSLIFWGPRPWAYSGFYHLEVLTYISAYPSTFAMAISFLSLYFYIMFFKSKNIFYYLILFPLAPIVLISHPITAIFLFIGIIAIAISEDCQFSMKLVLPFCIITVAFLSAILWPYFSFIELIKISVFDASNYPMYKHIFKQTYPVWLGIPLLIQRIRHNKRDVLGLMFIGLSILYIYGGVSGKYSYGRLISFIVLIFDIIIADWLARIELEIDIRHLHFWQRIALYGGIAFIFILVTMHIKPLSKIFLPLKQTQHNILLNNIHSYLNTLNNTI